MASIIPLKDSTGAQFYPQTHEKAVVDSNGVSLQTKLQSISAPSYVVAWDGDSTPVVANIPAGVTFTYDGNTYTGTLAASSSTTNKTYLVGDNNGNFDEYVTQVNGSTYSWQYLGNTEIDLSDYVTQEEFDQKYTEVVPPSSNIFNPYDGVEYYHYIKSTGEVAADTTDHLSGYIPVKASTTYVVSDVGYIALFNSSKTFISRKSITSTTKTFTTTAETAYIRAEFIRTLWQNAHINEGTTLETKVPFSAGETYDQVERNADDLVAVNNALFADVREPYTNFSSGYIINKTYPGDVADVANPGTGGGYVYAIIPVSKGDRFWIKGTGGTNARLYSINNADNRNVILRGPDYATADGGEAIDIPIDGNLIVNFVTSVPHGLWRVVRKAVVENEEASLYNKSPYLPLGHQFAQRYRSLQTDFSFRGETKTYAEAIAAMDALMAEDTAYITKEAIGTAEGTDAGGNEYTLYEYVFTPKSVAANTMARRPKVLIGACIHGFEKTALYGWYHFLKDLVENYEQNETLASIRSLVEIHFIPVINPWGFDRDERNNANGVNLNRNFQVPNWEEVASGANASGADPFDQSEAAAVRDWMVANDDALCYIDTHTNGHYYASGWVEANAVSVCDDLGDNYYDRMFSVLKRHIEKQTAIFGKDYDLSISSIFGQFTNDHKTTTSGFAYMYATLYRKLVAMNLEGFNGLSVSDVNVFSYESADNVKVNSEIFGNMLAEILEEYTPE